MAMLQLSFEALVFFSFSISLVLFCSQVKMSFVPTFVAVCKFLDSNFAVDPDCPGRYHTAVRYSFLTKENTKMGAKRKDYCKRLIN